MCRHFDIPDDNMDALIATLRRICDFLHTTIRNGGRVLVYCSSEFRASAIVCAYRAFPGTLSFMDGELTPDYLTVMFSQRISAKAATNILSTGSFGQINR